MYISMFMDDDFQCYSRLAFEFKIVPRVSTEFGLLVQLQHSLDVMDSDKLKLCSFSVLQSITLSNQ